MVKIYLGGDELIDARRIRSGVVSMFRSNMGLRDGESILILTDVPRAEDWTRMDVKDLFDLVKRSFLARAVSEIAKEEFKECHVEFYAYLATGRSGTEPPPVVAEKMRDADVVVAITTYSITHTEARKEATKAGARIASMPGFLEEMFYPGGPITVDYFEIKRLSERLAQNLTEARHARVSTPAGTNIEFSLEGRCGIADTGILVKKGAYGNLPAGEAFIAPVEGTANGKIVVQAGWFPGLVEDMILIVKNGEVTSIEGGGKVGERIKEELKPGVDSKSYKSRRNIAELGIGTNPAAKRPDNILEAEKIMGTVHIAIGDNSHIGGEVPADLHVDFILPKPDLYLDNKQIIKEGKIIPDYLSKY